MNDWERLNEMNFVTFEDIKQKFCFCQEGARPLPHTPLDYGLAYSHNQQVATSYLDSKLPLYSLTLLCIATACWSDVMCHGSQ